MINRIRVIRTFPEDRMKRSVADGRVTAVARLPFLGVLVVGLLLPVMTGCPGALEGSWPAPTGGGATGGMSGGGTGGSGTTGACDAVAKVFSNGTPTACASSGCHSAVFPPLLTGTSADIWPRLFNQPQLAQNSCPGNYVDGANLANSVILKRVSGNSCGANTLMPYLSTAPDQMIVDCLTSWINGPH
jgi:hypothetical protein